ncbi:transcriptional regulator, AraC family [Thalassoporum mexicanum PCC 7367]|uniref:methylated-DNA--[protein]-cysteine S-methyltransferase n=1 Tax=Thalassoporum mexicanum TaxID=3457544 RepID=UPI00029FC24B|nr:methylated-DNA--[protein]-cysteine S-methyltransferase [Pseudanabaena sp. PCC 7367]AFY70740.1 transcriptional regulator, AraC family [Pseudanabaena sp. PCC 7367]
MLEQTLTNPNQDCDTFGIALQRNQSKLSMDLSSQQNHLDRNDSQTYELISKAIEFMRDHHRDQPDLATIAAQTHLSAYHFQRLFKKWAGISPKRFSQFLTVEYAKARITQTPSLLDLSLDAGLSSSGRLHDLFVNLEAMSPGEYKAGGAGLKIWYGVHPTPFGDCLIATTSRGICNLYFIDAADQAEQELRQDWSRAELMVDQNRTRSICDRLFNSNPTDRPLSLHLKGTNFQIQVWRALLQIPSGTVTTYQNIAAAIDRPKSSRAVGTAIGRNPISYLIPCHRVIRGSGHLGGYRWGLTRKSALLGWEASQFEAQEQPQEKNQDQNL